MRPPLSIFVIMHGIRTRNAREYKCVNSSAYAALEKVELLSDILAHDEDVTEKHQPAPVL